MTSGLLVGQTRVVSVVTQVNNLCLDLLGKKGREVPGAHEDEEEGICSGLVRAYHWNWGDLGSHPHSSFC